MSDRVVWFDLPSEDLERAMHFYAAVLDTEMSETYPGVSVIPAIDGGIHGCLFQSEEYLPSENGALLYFNVSGRLAEAVAQVVPNGGTVKEPPHPIGEHGRRAIVLDSEGNRIVLHSE